MATVTSQPVGLIMWNPYSGASAILLSLFLFALGVSFILLGVRLTRSFRFPMPRITLKVLVVLIWVVSILLVLPLFRRVAKETGQSALNIGPVFPITLASAICTFAFIAYVSRHAGVLPALANAFAGAAAGPMVFELPFVLIIAPMVTDPVRAGLLLFVTFLVVILSTLALPLFSSRFGVTRYSLYLLGAMVVVFGTWALATGYAPPSDPVSFSLNAVSKVLGFAAVAATFAGPGKKPKSTEVEAAVQGLRSQGKRDL